MIKRITLPCILLWSFSALALNNAPTVIIQSANVDEAAQQVNITYHLADAENNTCEVWLKFSQDGGVFFDTIAIDELTGNFGSGIIPGNSKTLTWNYSAHSVNILDTKIQLFASDGQPVSIADMVNAIDSNALKSSMSYIEGVRHQATAPAHLNEVRDSIEYAFLNNGLNTERHTFTYNSNTGINILGRKSGVKNEATTFIIDAHYDGVAGAPAADDNGTGVAGMLEALRILSQYNFEHSIRFIGFDYEESGLIGSNRYLLSGIKPFENIEGVLNFEMIGYSTEVANTQTTPAGFNILFPATYQQLQADSFRGNFLIVCGNDSSAGLTSTFVNAATQYVPALKTAGFNVPDKGQIAPDLRRSDHASFWDKNKKAIMLTDGANTRNPNYHTPGDSVGTLNFNFMTNVVKATLAAAAKLAKPISVGYAQSDLWPLSIEDNHHDHTFPASVEVYPNPANGNLSLKVNANETFRTKLELYDLKGSVVWNSLTEFTKGKSTQSFKLNDLPSGSYILVLNNGHSNLSRTIVIKK
jgi:hypothetical protein